MFSKVAGTASNEWIPWLRCGTIFLLPEFEPFDDKLSTRQCFEGYDTLVQPKVYVLSKRWEAVNK